MTIRQLNSIIDRYNNGERVADIANDFDLSYSYVYRVLKQHGVIFTKRHRKLNQYAIYDKHDNFLVQGTAAECSEYMGVKVESFYRMLTRQKYGGPQRIFHVELDSEE